MAGDERLTLDDLRGMLDYEIVDHIAELRAAYERRIEALVLELAASEARCAVLVKAGDRLADRISRVLGTVPETGVSDWPAGQAAFEAWRSLRGTGEGA